MKRLTIFTSFALFISFCYDATATHIVGGEMNYRYLGNDNYEISLTVFRDCYNGVPAFDNPASIGIFNSSNTLVSSILTPFLGLDTVPAAINNPCIIPPTNICYEVTTYIDTLNLPPIAGGYHLVYQRCCRNNTIINIQNPGATGATYKAEIPRPAFATNSNPVFNNWAPPFICANSPFVFDHSATDIDGDSLVYELFDPFHGASSSDPMPQPPFNPPYTNVAWQTPFTTNDMLGGVPLTIDAQTGMLTANPNTQGQFVVGIKVKEYRNGVYVSETKRDFQINVVNCPIMIVSSIQAPSVICGSYSVGFGNTSSGAVTYFWDFGDNTTLADTSLLANPTYTYPDTGTYTIMLIAYSSQSGCNDTSFYTIEIIPPFTGDFTFETFPCLTNVLFTDTFERPPTTIQWDFGDGNSSSNHNPTHTYAGAGVYNVTMTAYDAICDTTITVTYPVQITSGPIADLGPDKNVCEGKPIQFLLDAGVSTLNYVWSTGESTQTIVANTPGEYWVEVSDGNCDNSDTLTIGEWYPIPVEGYETEICAGDFVTLTSETGASSFLWSTGAKTPTITVSKGGIYWFEVTDKHGCISSDTVVVTQREATKALWFPNTFTPNGDGLNDVFKPIGFGIEDFRMTIFDRWGQQIYYTEDYEQNPWDGTVQGTGRVVKNGVYVYKIYYASECIGGKRKERVGHVVVIR